MKKFDPNLPLLQRPAVRPNAAWSAADHDMIIYDLAERDSGKAMDIFAENKGGELPARYINHIALRATNPERSADFYRRVLTTLGFRDFGPWEAGEPEVA